MVNVNIINMINIITDMLRSISEAYIYVNVLIKGFAFLGIWEHNGSIPQLLYF